MYRLCCSADDWNGESGELEYDFLLYAVHFIKTLVFRYDQPSFSYYRLQQEIVRQKISADVMEMYKNAFSGINGICFDALYHSLDQTGFQEFVDRARIYMENEVKKRQGERDVRE